MTIWRAISTIVGCTLLVAAIGAGVGYGLGALAPEYYRGVFMSGRDPQFNPIRVGVGLGLTQGTAGGVMLGLAVVALLCWRETRLQRGAGQPVQATGRPGTTGVVARRLLLGTSALLVFGICLSSSLFVGLLRGERGAYHRRYLEERQAFAPVLAGDPAFANVEIRELSAGGVYLHGEVATAADRERLQSLAVKAVGEARAKEVMGAVHVKQ